MAKELTGKLKRTPDHKERVKEKTKAIKAKTKLGKFTYNG